MTCRGWDDCSSEEDDDLDDQGSKGMVIWLVAGFAVFLLFLMVGLYCMFRRSPNIRNSVKKMLCPERSGLPSSGQRGTATIGGPNSSSRQTRVQDNAANRNSNVVNGDDVVKYDTVNGSRYPPAPPPYTAYPNPGYLGDVVYHKNRTLPPIADNVRSQRSQRPEMASVHGEHIRSRRRDQDKSRHGDTPRDVTRARSGNRRSMEPVPGPSNTQTFDVGIGDYVNDGYESMDIFTTDTSSYLTPSAPAPGTGTANTYLDLPPLQPSTEYSNNQQPTSAYTNNPQTTSDYSNNVNIPPSKKTEASEGDVNVEREPPPTYSEAVDNNDSYTRLDLGNSKDNPEYQPMFSI